MNATTALASTDRRQSTPVPSADVLFPEIRPATQIGDRELARFGTILEIDPPTAWPMVARLVQVADGTTSLAVLADALATDPQELVELCLQLEQHGFLWLTPPQGPIPIPLFQAEFRRWVRHWVDQIFSHPIWDEILDGQASPAVLVGWSIEQMHYTRTVIEHMTHAARLAGETPEGRTLLRHLSQEWDHYLLFLRGCASVGIGDSRIRDAVPLSSTRVVTTFMRQRAVSDPLVYNACEALLEGTTEHTDSVVAFFRAAQKRYDYPATFIDPMVNHVKVDESFEHIDIFDHLLSLRDSLPRGQVADILGTCAEFADLLTLWHGDIARFYSSKPAPFVREQRRAILLGDAS
jgi:hypothetical protein